MKVVITNTQHDEQVIRAALRFAAQVVKRSYPEWKHDKLIVKVKNHAGPYWRGTAYPSPHLWSDRKAGFTQLVTLGIGKCNPIRGKSIGSLDTVIESIIFLAAHEFDHSARQYISGGFGRGEELANWQGRHAVLEWRKANPQ